MKIKTEITLAALLAAGLLAAAFASSASAINSTQQRFKAEIKGVQTGRKGMLDDVPTQPVIIKKASIISQ